MSIKTEPGTSSSASTIQSTACSQHELVVNMNTVRITTWNLEQQAQHLVPFLHHLVSCLVYSIAH